MTRPVLPPARRVACPATDPWSCLCCELTGTCHLMTDAGAVPIARLVSSAPGCAPTPVPDPSRRPRLHPWAMTPLCHSPRIEVEPRHCRVWSRRGSSAPSLVWNRCTLPFERQRGNISRRRSPSRRRGNAGAPDRPAVPTPRGNRTDRTVPARPGRLLRPRRARRRAGRRRRSRPARPPR